MTALFPRAVQPRRSRRGWRPAALAGVALAGLLALPRAAAAWDAPVPVLDWQPCTGATQQGFDCATATVPLNYAEPHGETISLAVIRHTATGPGSRLGAIFWNPGGPGAPGTLTLPLVFNAPTTPAPNLFPVDLRERFDIISWDPRGVGESTAVTCFPTPADETAYIDSLPLGVPVTLEQRRAWIQGWAHVAELCGANNSQALLQHVSTTDTVHDLDLLRQAVGEEQLNYQGNSYGTFLGAVYANLFPDKVRAMVMMGNVDAPGYTNSGDENPVLNTSLRQDVDTKGAAKTLNAFFKLCGQASTDACAFSAGSAAATKAKWNTLLERVLTNPVVVGSVTYNYDAVVTTTVVLLYQVPEWTIIANMLQALWEGSTDPSLYPPQTPGVLGQLPSQALAVKCSESPNPRNPAAYFALSDLAQARAGAVGPYWVWLDEQCAAWPATAADAYTGPWNQPTKPILLVNNTYDPATPYASAQLMADQLANTRLLTVAGYGHADGGVPSTCANDYISSYFIEGTLPPVGAVCRQDIAPFAGSSSPSE